MAVLFFFILSVPVPKWYCCLVWYWECLYQCCSALFCDKVSACTEITVLCCVILSVPVPLWQCSVVWYCQCLYQCGSALLCDTVSACTNVAVLCCVILSVPVPMWQCSVLWFYNCLYQCGSAVLCDSIIAYSIVAAPFLTESCGTSFSPLVTNSLPSLDKTYSCSLVLISCLLRHVHS